MILLLIAFLLLGIGSKIVVNAIVIISHKLKASTFFISFFVLGLFTSITELMIGINAFLEGQPQIFVGNLLGSTMVVYLLIIPMLAIFGNGIKLNHSLNFKEVITAIMVGGLPAVLTLDNVYGRLDAIVSILLYIYLIFMLTNKSNLLEKLLHKSISTSTLILNAFKLLIGVTLVFFGSHTLVEQIPNLGTILGMSPFVISILLLSLGTNIPEITIAITSLLSKQKDVAFGNYIGSASLNTLELGLLTVIGKGGIIADGSNYSVLSFAAGLVLFLIFLKSKSTLSRFEGIVLLGSYLLFIFLEIFTGPGWKIGSI